ncbi:hypothetical protein NWO25_05890 [Enterococcus lactis]|nr:hypothetical protein [Enterococcus lactis]
MIQHLLQTEMKEQLLIHLQITKPFTGNYHLQRSFTETISQ